MDTKAPSDVQAIEDITARLQAAIMIYANATDTGDAAPLLAGSPCAATAGGKMYTAMLKNVSFICDTGLLVDLIREHLQPDYVVKITGTLHGRMLTAFWELKILDSAAARQTDLDECAASAARVVSVRAAECRSSCRTAMRRACGVLAAVIAAAAAYVLLSAWAAHGLAAEGGETDAVADGDSV